MSDDKNDHGPRDHDPVNTNEDYAVRCWTKTRGITEQELRDAAKCAGPMAKDMQKAHGK